MNNISGYIQPTVNTTGGDENNTKVIIVVIVSLTILILVIMVLVAKNKSTPTGTAFFENNQDKLEKCGWELYITMTCPYCIKQKEILTTHFPTFSKIYTDKPVNVVPTWHNVKTNKTIEGMQTYEKLLNMINC